MLSPRASETNSLFFLRWSARITGAFSVAMLLLFMFGEESGSWSRITGKQAIGMLFFPLGLISGLILGWQEEKWGGLLAVVSVAAFYVIYGLVLNGSMQLGWWFLVFAAPGFLFLLYGLLYTPGGIRFHFRGHPRRSV